MKKHLEYLLNSNLIWVIAGLTAWLIGNWPFLTNEYMFSHDSYYWYGIFHYFVESLWAGFWPTWNPYSHAGELFFTNLGMWNLIDPITMASIGVGKILKANNLFYLYEMIMFVKIFIRAAGVQLLINELIPEMKKYWSFTFFILVLSGFAVTSYHQNGSMFVFSYVPFIMLFFIRFLKKQSWFNTICLGYITGTCFHSMHFFYVASFLMLFMPLFLLFNREYIKTLWASKIKVTAALAVFLVFSAPAWSLIFYKFSLYPYARSLFTMSATQAPIFFNSIEDYKLSLAAFGQLADFLTMGFLPLANLQFIVGLPGGLFSEMSLFIGFIPFVLGVVGLIKGKHQYKTLFIILLILSAILFLGPQSFNFLYTPLFYTLPLLRGIENTHSFSNYFLMCYLFFVALGIVYVSNKLKSKWIIWGLFVITLCEFGLYHTYIYQNNTLFNAIKTEDVQLKANEHDHNKISFKPDTNFTIEPRIKTVLPYYFGQITNDEGIKDLLNVRHTINYKLNFRSLIQKTSTATDFYTNFHYDYLRIRPPASLTYPVFYTDILKAKIPQNLKATLLGVYYPVFEFYTSYKVMPTVAMLKNENHDVVSNALKDNVILNEEPNLQSAKNNKIANLAEIKIVKYTPSKITLDITAPRDGILLFRDGYNPNWTAQIDGKTEKVLRANYNSKALQVKKGRHKVIFEFIPLGFNIAVAVYLIASALFFIYMSFVAYRNIRKNSTQKG